MEVESVMVTGANQGIGLEFVKQLVKLPKPPRIVFAADKNESNVQDLKDIQEKCKETEIVLIQMDVTKTSDIESAKNIVAEKVGEKGLNLLINNAGVARKVGFTEVTEMDFWFHFSTNTIGPVMVLKVMLPLLQLSATQNTSGLSVSRAAVINISSQGGSITTLTDAQPKEYLKLLAYRTSKAALNMSMRVVSLTLKDQGILVVNMCPGWVKTQMGTDQGMLEPSESISAMLHTFQNLNESHQGAFLNRNGNTIPF